jgi:gliding motility-associated-like protein
MKSFSIAFCIFLCVIVKGQTIQLYAIDNNRQNFGDEGYTLNGKWMDQSARPKLLNPAYFGPTGTYPKTVVISDSFPAIGSLDRVGRLPAGTLFFFGTFGSEPFTESEIDSLHKWSLRGGKVIMTAGLNQSGGITPLVNSKWGFTPIIASTSIVPTALGQSTDLFNGPFGSVPNLSQTGSLQGFYFKIPGDAKVMATIPDGRPAIYLDCKTLDLLVVDTDVFTTLGYQPPSPFPGSYYIVRVSPGANIINTQDIFLANTIAFMDKLQSPPVLFKNGNQLSVNANYLEYTWYHNDVAIAGANSESFSFNDEGNYYVEVKVNGGCKIKSDIHKYYLNGDTMAVDPECEAFVPTAFSPDNNGSNDKACAYSACLEDIDFRIFNRWGELIFQSKEPGKCWDGIYRGAKANSGVYAWTLKAKRKSGTEISKKGNITLIR